MTIVETESLDSDKLFKDLVLNRCLGLQFGVSENRLKARRRH